MDLGKRLRELRERRGFSIYEVERRARLHFSTISKYERNERQPSIDVLQELADVYGVPLASIFAEHADFTGIPLGRGNPVALVAAGGPPAGGTAGGRPGPVGSAAGRPTDCAEP